MKRWLLPFTAVAGIACVVLLLGVGLGWAGGKKSAGKSAASSKYRDPRPPKSGSCNNSDNKCSGEGETCKDNTCYCQGPRYARCDIKPEDSGIFDCRDLFNYSPDCGACGHQCKGDTLCQNGKCVSPGKVKCDPGETNCPEGCRDLKTDASACGKCGHACKDGWSCVSGKCVEG